MLHFIVSPGYYRLYVMKGLFLRLKAKIITVIASISEWQRISHGRERKEDYKNENAQINFINIIYQFHMLMRHYPIFYA